LRQVKGAMNSAGHRGLDGCPMFALANVGRKSRAKPIQRFGRSGVRLFIRSEAEGSAVQRSSRGNVRPVLTKTLKARIGR
jgi:hypothetical protein